MNRGFETMLPRKEVESKPLFYYRFSFRLFKRTFSLTIKIKE